MKKWVALLFVCIYANGFSQTNISPQFSELKGMEDQLGNTHLFYRIGTAFSNPPLYQWSNHIYHMDLFSNTDTLFITASGYEDPINNFNKWVSDVDYWNDNPTEFIYCGGATAGQFFEGSAYVQRFDGYNNYFGLFWGTSDYVDISQLNDSLLYAGIITDGGPGILKSNNGGRSWDSVSVVYQFLSLCPTNEDIYFVENEDRELFRTTDAGNSFNLVDPEFLVDTRFYYDSDGLHVYRKANSELIISNNLGEQFSWQTKYSSDSEIYISVDGSRSGYIYLADEKNIFISTDYGNTFNLYKTLDRDLVGIYKKASAGCALSKLYAATKYKIYEITPDTIQVIKSLPVGSEVLNQYPLAIGNKWVYDTWGWWWDGTIYHAYSGITYREVVGDTLMANGQSYFKLFDPTTYNFSSLLFERIDTASGKVYRYNNTLGLPDNEYLIDDLFAEVADSIWSSRHMYQDYIPFICIGEGTFNKWGIQGSRKIFTIYDLTGYTYSLAQGVGIDSIYSSFDFGENFTAIKGCIINGVVYGDTTTVGVEDEENPIANEFTLEQNYPNPFNPTTKIGFQISEFGFVSLKIYDVLGNEIATLVNEEKPAGEYEIAFDSHSGEVRNLVSGIYFYQLRAGDFVQTKKMILLK